MRVAMSPARLANRLIVAAIVAAAVLASTDRLWAAVAARDVAPTMRCGALPRPHMRLRLTVSATRMLDPTPVIRRIVADTWQDEGLTFEWLTGEEQPASPADVWVAVVSGRQAQRDGVMGEVLLNGGDPRPLIRIFIEPVVEWVRSDETARFRTETRVLNLTIGDTSALIPRALAYVASHELGHFLLGSSRHAPSGLMRAHFRGAHRLLTEHGSLSLDRGSKATLEARVSAGAACR